MSKIYFRTNTSFLKSFNSQELKSISVVGIEFTGVGARGLRLFPSFFFQ